MSKQVNTKWGRSHWALNEFREGDKKAGICIDCGQQRGSDGTTIRCRPCANRANDYGKKRNKERQ